VLVVGLAVLGVVLAVRRAPLGTTVYAAASLLLPLMFPLADRPLMSMPRFAAVLFPVAWGFALVSERRARLGEAILVTSVVAYAVHATLFINWQYVF
jgi:hypothetical protein